MRLRAASTPNIIYVDMCECVVIVCSRLEGGEGGENQKNLISFLWYFNLFVRKSSLNEDKSVGACAVGFIG